MVNEFASMIGATVVKVTGHEQGSDSMTFHADDGHDACYSDGEAASVRFVWLGSDDPEVAARYIGHEHRFTARAQVPHYYEEL